MMAKDRTNRYRHAEDLLIDLECLARGQPPKLVNERFNAGALEQLASGDAEDDEKAGISQRQAHQFKIGLIVAGVLLALSFVINIILLFKPVTPK